ncbi:MAG TPA: response regulator [Acidimicrobiales bacterium]|nr:response regulator [Acidimicrobiales bacterium]
MVLATIAVLTIDDDHDDEVVPPSRATPRQSGQHSEPSTSRPAPATTGRILVAEDDIELRRSLVDLFELPGYTVLEAGDGEEALERLADRPDVVVLDLHMPKLDGLSVLEALGDPPPMVILYSAFSLYHPEEIFARGLRGKIFRTLRKPAPPAQLLEAVADALAELGKGKTP